MDVPWQNADSFVKIYGQVAHKKNRLSLDPAVRISTVTFFTNQRKYKISRLIIGRWTAVANTRDYGG
jgi:hypothetical protein